jgi:uncharacterized protein (UPF0147 family)
MGLLYYLASESLHHTRKAYRRLRHNQVQQASATVSSNETLTRKITEITTQLEEAENCHKQKNFSDEHIHYILAKELLHAITNDEKTPEDVKKTCAKIISGILVCQPDVELKAKRAVRSLAATPKNWRSNMEGVTELNQIVTILQNLLYVDPSDEFADEILDNQQGLFEQDEVQKKRDLVQKGE